VPRKPTKAEIDYGEGSRANRQCRWHRERPQEISSAFTWLAPLLLWSKKHHHDRIPVNNGAPSDDHIPAKNPQRKHWGALVYQPDCRCWALFCWRKRGVSTHLPRRSRCCHPTFVSVCRRPRRSAWHTDVPTSNRGPITSNNHFPSPPWRQPNGLRCISPTE